MISYFAPFYDHTGYGDAARQDVAALTRVGVEVQPDVVAYTRDRPDFGQIGALLKGLEKLEGKSFIRILHTTPDQFPRSKREGYYHIGRFFWETTVVPPDFVEGLNSVDEVWTGTEGNRLDLITSGVTKPIYVIPQAIDVEPEEAEPYEIEGQPFVFYTIAEWIDRKNIAGLIEAYVTEFKDNKDVLLVLKTYHRNFDYANKIAVREWAHQVIDNHRKGSYPKIKIIEEMLDQRSIQRLHAAGNCFVSAHRGEGWGRPQLEAIIRKNPVISTGYGGIHEYFTDKELFMPDFSLVPVSGMAHSQKWYTSDQLWAEPNMGQFAEQMRFVYDNQPKAKAQAERAFKRACSLFDYAAVGMQMQTRLQTITEELRQ